MRTFIGFLLGLVVLGLGFWAYQENYRTRAALSEMRKLQADIVALQQQKAMLRAEWAWLNRPDRLQALVQANGMDLLLIDMEPEHFGMLDQVAFPTRPFQDLLPEPQSAPADPGDLSEAARLPATRTALAEVKP